MPDGRQFLANFAEKNWEKNFSLLNWPNLRVHFYPQRSRVESSKSFFIVWQFSDNVLWSAKVWIALCQQGWKDSRKGNSPIKENMPKRLFRAQLQPYVSFLSQLFSWHFCSFLPPHFPFIHVYYAFFCGPCFLWFVYCFPGVHEHFSFSFSFFLHVHQQPVDGGWVPEEKVWRETRGCLCLVTTELNFIR